MAANGTAPAGISRRSVEGSGSQDVFIHGWVYDIETGEIRDLGVSVGPPNKTIPAAPFALVASAAQKVEGSHSPGSTPVAGSSTKEAAPSATATAGSSSSSVAAAAATPSVVAEVQQTTPPLLATSSAHHA